ncbi:MAG: HlyD family efflux transporter periplasmic adaptor subunit [Candidatus Polarisedimenticolia bacterium]
MVDLNQALWRQLQEATSTESFCAAWLTLQCQMLGGASSGVVVLKRPETGAFAPVAFWPRGAEERLELASVVERALKERKGIALRAEPAPGQGTSDAPFHLAYPVWAAGRVQGAAAVQISSRPQPQLQAGMRQLQWGVAWLQNWVLRQQTDPESRGGSHLRLALEMAARALEEGRFQGAATAVATELATRLECDRVSLGFLSRRQVRVSALSHSAQFKKQMNLIRAIGTAMSESVDQHAILVYPETEEAGAHVLYAHEQLARGHGSRYVCTVPFIDSEGRAYGALTLERAGGEPFDRGAVEVVDSIGALVGPILEEKRRNDRLLITKAGDSLWSQIRKLTGPRHAVLKLITASIVALAIFFTFATGLYRVTAKTTLEGEVRRAVTAPYRGFIAEAPARAGDVVKLGAVLCSMDVRDLNVERAKWSSQREQFLMEQRKAMAEGDMAAMRVSSKKMDQAQAELALLDEQMSRARIVAPFDGLVVNGDLSQSLGAPVDAGQLLYEIAPLESYRLMLRVDERDVRDVKPGQKGTLILTSLPESRLRFQVTKVTPVSVAEEGHNHFIVEASLDKISERLRPGMEGFAKVEIDRRRLIWIWTHDLIDWARLWVWSWWP